MLMAENTSGLQTMQSTKEGSASFISKMLFWWLRDVIWTGFRKPLEMVNLDNLSPDFEGRTLGARLSKEWKRQSRRASPKTSKHIGIAKSLQALLKSLRSIFNIKKAGPDSIEMNNLNATNQIEEDTMDQSSPGPNLLWVCFRAFTVTLLTPVFPRIAMSGVTLALPFLVRDTLAFAESHTEPSTAQPTTYGWGLVGAYAFVYLVLSFSTGQFYWACDRGQIKLRGALLDMIYRKSLRLHLSAARTTGGGAAANLMAVDLERVVRAIIPFHTLWSGLLIVIVAAYLLYIQLGLVFLSTLCSIIVCIGFPIIASRGIGGRQARWSKATDERVNLTSSAINNAKGVKFMAYENVIVQRLIEERANEINYGWSYYKQLLIVSGFTNVVTEIMAVTTFTTLAIVDYVSGSHRLDVNLVVTTLTLMQLLESPLLQMGQNYSSIIAALVSLRRIQEFLVKDEKPVNAIQQSARPSSIADSFITFDTQNRGRSASLISDAFAASFQSASLGWSPSKPILINVNLDIPWKQLTMVCGTLASGKSTLLQALLGETNVISGNLHLPIRRAPIAYVAQDGWLQEGATIQDNIIFDAPFDAEKYQSVVNATALHIDFKELPRCDQSLAKALSGGQRQRVTLARALYANAESYILDDFTSALDAETASHVWSCLFTRSDGLLRGKTVIMATNALQLLKDASLIVRLDDGMVIEATTYEGLSSRGIEAVGRQSIEVESVRPDTEATAADTTKIKEEKEDDKHEEVEQGKVKWSVYGDWFKAMGFVFMAFYLTMDLAHTGALLGWNTFLQYWGRNAQTHAYLAMAWRFHSFNLYLNHSIWL
jgi:ATP-binding cassette subfamily C (CFTR/MRP) protein 1